MIARAARLRFSLLATIATFASSPISATELPKFSASATEESYPASLIRSQVEGRVTLIFSVNLKGRASNARVFVSESMLLEAPALKYLGQLRFNVPTDWDERARLFLGFSYSLKDPPGTCQTTVALEPADTLVAVCATKLRR